MKSARFAPIRPTRSQLCSFFSRVRVEPAGCWTWLGSINPKGYGIYLGTSAHRFTYAWFCAAIPANHEVDHLCRNRRCVNPAHGEAVLGIENRRRANRFDQTGRCRRGHLLFDTLAIQRNHDGAERICRECRRISQARYFKTHGRIPGGVLGRALRNEQDRLFFAEFQS